MENIYKEYSKIVYSYLLTLTNNKDIASELTQETFYKAMKNISKFRNESTLKNWLCKIAKNEWIDYYKKNKKHQEINIDDINENLLIENTLEDDYNQREELINMYKIIHSFDEEIREVMYLRIRAELSFKEIGNIMGKSEEWARVNYYRAKLKLKEDLK